MQRFYCEPGRRGAYISDPGPVAVPVVHGGMREASDSCELGEERCCARVRFYVRSLYVPVQLEDGCGTHRRDVVVRLPSGEAPFETSLELPLETRGSPPPQGLTARKGRPPRPASALSQSCPRALVASAPRQSLSPMPRRRLERATCACRSSVRCRKACFAR